MATDTPSDQPDTDLATWECPIRVVVMDFATKTVGEIPRQDIQAALDAGKFVWIDAQPMDVEAARRALDGLGLLPAEVLGHTLTDEPATQLARYENCLHLALASCEIAADGHLELERTDVVAGASETRAEGKSGRSSWLVTVHRHRPAFLEAVRGAYRADFLQHAQSPSFLIYEIWDHLLDSYHRVQKAFEDRVEQVQTALMQRVDDETFQRVSDLGAALLHFRKVLLPARATLSDLSSRRSMYISEATQPYLANMVATVERILQDVLVDRDILAESLNLYMSMVGHRTNRVMNKLTAFSVIFMPLSFVCGIYGMNFEVLPELKWHYGYLVFFWGVVMTIVSVSLIYLRRSKVL